MFSFYTLSSALICRIRLRIWNLRKLSVPKELIFMYLHKDTSWGRVKLSKVSSSSKLLATLSKSSVDACSPVIRIYYTCQCLFPFHPLLQFTFLKKSEKSLAAWGLADPGNPDSAIVSCRNSAISNRTLSNLRFFSS